MEYYDFDSKDINLFVEFFYIFRRNELLFFNIMTCHIPIIIDTFDYELLQ